MPYLSRRTFLELASASLICGCSSVKHIAADTDFPVLVFSDLHFDPFFDPTKFSDLNSADVSQWAGIFENSSITTPSIPGLDTNYPLLRLALASIKENVGASPLILYTGDLLGHGIAQNYAKYSTTGSDAAAIEAFTDKTASFVMQQIRSTAGDLPVFFAVGNCDSYTGYGPDSSFLSNTADLFYTQLLNSSTDHQAFVASFNAGGYYSAEPSGMNLMVIALNTIQFSPSVQNKDGSENNQGAVAAELAWFDARVAAAQTAGKKVWLLMHAPPGADEGTTASNSVEANGDIASATMMWEPNYQAMFIEVLAKYPGVISLTLAGHTHMDEYRVISAGNVVCITPGISPCFKNDPAYKVFTMDRATLAPTDYSSLNCDLAATPSQFNSYYTFSKAYPLTGSLENSLELLCPQLVTNPALQALYRGYFYSGANIFNPITDANWPVYWGGIGNMWQQGLINAVNSYR